MFISILHIFIFLIIKPAICQKTLFIIHPFYNENALGLDRFYDNLEESSFIWNENQDLLKICRIVCLKGIMDDETTTEITSNPQNIIWYMSWIRKSHINIYYGPFPVPNEYLYFPNVDYEEKWYLHLAKMKGYVVQTKRIRNHLVKRSNTFFLLNKYLVVPNCIKYEPVSNSSVNIWNNRLYDILLYLKFADLNKTDEGNILLNELSKEYKIKVIKYGSYKLSDMYDYANKSKFVLYFSFYDANPAALMEIQNMGVFAIVLQEELIDENNGIFIPELEYNITEAVSKIRKITKNKYDNVYLADYNRKKHDCINSFKIFLNQVT